MGEMSRRTFLVGAGAALATAALGVPDSDAGLLGRRFGAPRKLPSALTPNEEFYVTPIGSTPRVKAERWSLRVMGLVKNPLTLTYDALLKRPQTSMVSTLECIGNPIGGDSIGTARWEGAKLNAILDESGADFDSVQ